MEPMNLVYPGAPILLMQLQAMAICPLPTEALIYNTSLIYLLLRGLSSMEGSCSRTSTKMTKVLRQKLQVLKRQELIIR
jgi:hypothetical protein